MTPSARSIQKLRSAGWLVNRCEYWNPFARVRVDLFGVADLICVHPENDTVLLVQCTSASNFASRLKKVLASHEAKLWMRAPGRSIAIHGWRKSRRTRRWTLRELILPPSGYNENEPAANGGTTQ